MTKGLALPTPRDLSPTHSPRPTPGTNALRQRRLAAIALVTARTLLHATAAYEG